MAKVITMEEREAGKKKRGFAKFKADAKKVSKKVGKVLKKGGEVVKGVANHALSNPKFREFAKEKLKNGLYWLAGHPLADKLSYGNSKELKNWVDPVVEASDSYTGPTYFGPRTNFNFKPTAPNMVGKKPPVIPNKSPASQNQKPPVPPKKKPPPIPTKSPASQKSPTAGRASNELYV